ncbi:MAG: ATP phosphoribosyltransferase regulatory subunit [Gammaproteobacteria bacterium]|nr:ATP phosphoribosyltransferase regulatory subunit [Gammaproteobacteria bacterium]
MATADQWLLPDGIEELYPAPAAAIENLRRELLSLYSSWGYELVIPPLVEYLESLHTSMGSDLALQTMTITDQITGRMMGVRADMTPQVARIDAHGLNRDGPVRLCYAGTVLHAKPKLSGSRSIIQVGVELFGHASTDSDIEVIELMLRTLQIADCDELTLDLGHIAIGQSLLAQLDLSVAQENQLFNIYQRKAKVELVQFLDTHVNDFLIREILLQLPTLSGGPESLSHAREILAAYPDALNAIDTLEEIAKRITGLFPSLSIYYDLSESRGYRYHTGVVFAAYIPGQGQAIAKGGRYDDVGEKFGRARPATGFSTDIKSLIQLSNCPPEKTEKVFAPAGNDRQLREEINSLRAAGKIVVRELAGQKEGAKESGCNRQLVNRNGQWVVEKIK